MELLDKQLIEQNHLLSFEPKFFRIYEKTERNELEKLLSEKPFIQIHDQISTQLDDLIKLKHPKKRLNEQELQALKAAHIGNLSIRDYGVWVYYPWNEVLVHLLDEEEFVEVRTNRNIYKITREERDTLGKQKIGIVGLSVGQSISVTMAMERGFGEIRLADFDLLELTNLNRIRTGVRNLGLPKVVIVAREIKEIDPFLKVVCFPDGMTEENMDKFFCEGGNLDIIVDECDGLDIKILLRHKAKALRIPVVMDMNDRGTLDVERFDLEPDRPLLHGMIDHLDLTKIKDLKTNEEKIPYLLPMIGIDTISDRLKASMVEVGQSISTWPQLASAVALGGALGADVCRRIILDQYHESGRYFVDMEEQISDKAPKKDEHYIVKDFTAPDLTNTEMKTAAQQVAHDLQGDSLSKQQIEQLVGIAALAPSAGNNQPWKWFVHQGQLFLFHDEKHSASWGDFENITSNIAFGAAIETLKIQAGAMGLNVIPHLFPNKNNKRLIAAFSFGKNDGAPYCADLAAGIGLRLTNRKKGNKQPIAPTLVSSLKTIASVDSDVHFTLVQQEEKIQDIANIVAAVERIRFLYPQGHHDFYTKEIRWTDESAKQTRDGLDIKTLELSESDKTGMIVAANPGVITLLNKWGGGAAFEKLSKGAIVSSSAIGLISMPTYTPENFIKGGEAVQRVWLEANKNGLSFHPISAPLFLFARMDHGKGAEMTPAMVKELGELQIALKQIFPSLDDTQGIFMFRLSYADEASARSLRKPLEDILEFS